MINRFWDCIECPEAIQMSIPIILWRRSLFKIIKQNFIYDGEYLLINYFIESNSH